MKPTVKYLLIGSGRLARHLKYHIQRCIDSQPAYQLLQWSRRPLYEFNSKDPQEVSNADARLEQCAAGADIILFAVKDSAVEELAQQPIFQGKKLCHFSGALRVPGVFGMHPLMTFSKGLYPDGFYAHIPFVCEPEVPFEELFPFLPNPVYRIAPEKKPLYHALCHIGANLPALLWAESFRIFQDELGLPPSLLYGLIGQTLQNVMTRGWEALTGPLVRQDTQTLELHRQALAAHPELQQIVSHFQTFFDTVERKYQHECSPL